MLAVHALEQQLLILGDVRNLDVLEVVAGYGEEDADLILYGNGNPLDALDVFGKYIMEPHIKDGFYPTNGMELGNECAVGQGKADFPAIVRKMGELGYTGSFTIEREISGDQQVKDIAAARDLLREWMK